MTHLSTQKVLGFLNSLKNTSSIGGTQYLFINLLFNLIGSYEVDIEKLKQYLGEDSMTLALELEWLLSLDDNTLKIILEAVDDINFNLMQSDVAKPKILNSLGLDDDRRYKIFIEKIYYDLFHNNIESFKPELIKYLLNLDKEIQSRLLTFKEFQNINNTNNYQIYRKYSWAKVFNIKKFTNDASETVYKLIGDKFYKYVVISIIYTPPTLVERNITESKSLINKILAVTHEDKIEVINDFTEENKKQIEEIEKYYSLKPDSR